MAPQQNYHSISSLPYENDLSVLSTKGAIDERYQEIMSYAGQTDNKGEPSLWVFGYGSLVWLPKFSYSLQSVGYVTGYARRFWQGNSTHRGVPESPGRVATLIEDEKAVTWGTAYLLRGAHEINKALDHLYCREVSLGGYAVKSMDFHFRDSFTATKTVTAVTFMATPDSSQYLGPASIENLAATIVNSRGKSGHNLEYLFRLTDSLRAFAPEVRDHHLESLEDACHLLLSLKLLSALAEESSEDEYVVECLKTRKEFIQASLIKVSQKSIADNKHFFNARSE